MAMGSSYSRLLAGGTLVRLYATDRDRSLRASARPPVTITCQPCSESSGGSAAELDSAEALRKARNSDAIGHQIHTALAMLYLFLLPLTTAPKDFAFGLLFVWTAIRLYPHTWRCYGAIFRVPMAWALVAWAGWLALSLLWSVDPRQGFDELGAYRMLLTPLLIWPVIDRAPWLIGAALAGVFAQNLAQAFQQAGWIEKPSSDAARMRGFIHPIQTATWCAAALCWHTSAFLRGRGLVRIGSIVLGAAALYGLVASGSRGPWLAAAVAVPLGVLVIALRRPRARRAAIVLMVIGVVGAGAAWPLAQSRIMPRIEHALEEIRQAREQQVFHTSSGLRLGLSSWAWSIFREHPIIGAGAGSFGTLQRELPEFQAVVARHPSQEGYLRRDHPHSTYLYLLACTGLVGGAITLVVLVLMLRQAWRDRPDHVYADGSLCALLVWVIGAQFDCYNLSGHYFGLFALIAAITWPGRPFPRLRLAARDPDLDSLRARP